MSKTITRRAFLKTSSLVTLGTQIPALRALPREAEFRIGITTNTRGGWEKDLIKSFREASEVGYRAVETFYSFVQPYWEKPEEMKKILADLNLRFVTVSNGGPMVMQFEDPSKEKQIIEEHVKLVRWIKGFGCTHLKINTGGRRPEGTTEEDLKQMAKTMNELGKRISDEGLKFGVHAHLWTQLQDRAEIGRRVAVGDGAADRAAMTNLRVADELGAADDELAALRQERVANEVGVSSESADRDSVAVLPHVPHAV